MFFIISKILSFLLNPTFWILLILISAIIFKKRRRKLLILSVSLFWFFSNGLIVDIAYRLWEEDVISANDIEKTYDYGIILGGFSGFDNTKERVEFNECGDRLFYGIQLYKMGVIGKIIVSGGNGQLINEGYLEADWSKEFLIKCGIPSEDIIIENKSRNTWENAKYTSNILEEKRNANLLLITSAWHMKRAEYCFTKNYLDVDKFSTDNTINKIVFDLDYVILPSSDTFERWQTLGKEMVGNIVYRLKY